MKKNISSTNLEIEEMRQNKSQTLRPTVASIEDILYKPINVLDHGFIRVIDYMGDDSSIVQAARVSYGKGTKKINEDRGLINYLMRHHHTTPFEMCEIKLHIKLPIFIARQWIRHRTANVNEYSARYSVLDREFYMPTHANISPQSQVDKQCRDKVELSEKEMNRVLHILKEDSEKCYDHYMEMLNIDEETGEVLNKSRSGIARELARMNLTLNYYTQWYWKIDLHNLLHFSRLRADKHAQYEIRVYAEEICKIIEKWVPATYDAFVNYQLNSFNMSSSALQVVKRMIAGERVIQETSNMSKREWEELTNKLRESNT